MLKAIVVVLMGVMVSTPCLAQEIESDGLFSGGTTVWDCTCYRYSVEGFYDSPPPVFKENIVFYQGEFYHVIRFDEEECLLESSFRSSVHFETVGFIPVLFFEFENGGCVNLVSYCVSNLFEGMVFPLFDIGFYERWFDNSWGDSWKAFCNMRKLKTRHFDTCSIYFDP